MLDILAICLVITALLAYLNHRFVGLPTTIGVMAGALVFTLALVGLDALGVARSLRQYEEALLNAVRFPDVVLQGMLSLLLFAGALHVDLNALSRYRWPVAALAVVGTLLSTFAVAYGMWFALPVLGLELPLIYCLLFGALISPTDPIAVMSILKSAGAPKELELVISGESLFNDGIGVVVFMIIMELAAGGGDVTVGKVMQLFLQEAVGGVTFGLAIGGLAYLMLKRVDDYQLEVIITLALVMGGYSLADRLHTSGPLAMVAAGLLVGNHGRTFAMSDMTREHLDSFWELIDEILNAILFMLIGLALVAKIVGDHGGIIECDSRPRLTVFRALMPMSEAEIAPSGEA
jgi:CPA1 family monovalent cation:H+ antiporter